MKVLIATLLLVAVLSTLVCVVTRWPWPLFTPTCSLTLIQQSLRKSNGNSLLLQLKDTSYTFNNNHWRGSFSLKNRVIRGPSLFAPKHDIPGTSSYTFIMDHFELTGNYEIVDGLMIQNETSPGGVVKISGAGRFNFSMPSLLISTPGEFGYYPGSQTLLESSFWVNTSQVQDVKLVMGNLRVDGVAMDALDQSEELKQQLMQTYLKAVDVGWFMLNAALLDGCVLDDIQLMEARMKKNSF